MKRKPPPYVCANCRIGWHDACCSVVCNCECGGCTANRKLPPDFEHDVPRGKEPSAKKGSKK